MKRVDAGSRLPQQQDQDEPKNGGNPALPSRKAESDMNSWPRHALAPCPGSAPWPARPCDA